MFQNCPLDKLKEALKTEKGTVTCHVHQECGKKVDYKITFSKMKGEGRAEKCDADIVPFAAGEELETSVATVPTTIYYVESATSDKILAFLFGAVFATVATKLMASCRKQKGD